MGNTIKYSTGSESLALKKGNFYIGTGDVPKGPTSLTGFYNSYNPPENGWTMYFNKAVGGPATYAASNVTELIFLTNHLCGTNFSTSGECLNYFATQTDKVIFNRNYEPIVTNGLVLNLDAGFTPSYPTTGTTWYDLGTNGNNGTLTNGPTFNSTNGGSIVFDGVDDYVNFNYTNPYSETIIVWAKSTTVTWNTYGWISSCRKQNGHIIHPESSENGGKQVTFYILNSSSSFTSIGYIDVSNITIPHMYVLSTNGSNLHKCYFDGSLLNTNTTSITRTQSPTPQSWDVGRDDCCGGGRAGNGNIYNVLRYNRQLSDSEILQNYNVIKGRFGL